MDAWTAQLVEMAERACEIVGAEPAIGRQAALVAVAGYYADRAEKARLSAHWAESGHARKERISDAERHEALAQYLTELADYPHGIRPTQ